MRAPPCPAVDKLRAWMERINRIDGPKYMAWRDANARTLGRKFMEQDLPLMLIDEWVLDVYLQTRGIAA